MKSTQRNPVVISKDDFQLLKPFVKSGLPKAGQYSLSYELGRAVIVRDEGLPANTVRLNSNVSIEDLNTGRRIEFRLVMPAHADMTQKKVSILTPIGAALIGFRKGEEVEWLVPSGLKKFRILDVVNQAVPGYKAMEAA